MQKCGGKTAKYIPPLPKDKISEQLHFLSKSGGASLSLKQTHLGYKTRHTNSFALLRKSLHWFNLPLSWPCAPLGHADTLKTPATPSPPAAPPNLPNQCTVYSVKRRLQNTVSVDCQTRDTGRGKKGTENGGGGVWVSLLGVTKKPADSVSVANTKKAVNPLFGNAEWSTSNLGFKIGAIAPGDCPRKQALPSPLVSQKWTEWSRQSASGLELSFCGTATVHCHCV